MKRSRRPRYNTPLIIIAGVLLIAGGWWAYSRSSSPETAPLPNTHLVHNAPYTVDLAPSRSTIRPGDSVRLHFTVRKDGEVSDIYNEQRVLHYVIASANFRDFFHTFTPEEKGPGQFYLDHTFTQPGEYRIWTELVDTTKATSLHHGEHAEIVSYTNLTVAEGLPTGSLPLVTATDAWAERWHVISEQTGLKAGQPTKIRLHVEDKQGTILPVFPPEPAIYVMVGDNFEFYRHTHTTPAINEQFIEIEETFPEAGSYLFFTEIYVKDGEAYQIVQIPFQVTIK
jgi:plastocyanin